MNQALLVWQRWTIAHKRLLRIIQHTLIWLIVWGLSAVTVVYFVRDKQSIDIAVTILIALPTILYYYVLGYYVLPKFLYRFHPVRLVSSLVLTYWISYLINRIAFIELRPYSVSSASYLVRVAHLVETAGWFGCFTMVKLALWNYILGLYLVTLLLIVKTVRDITKYRNESIRLQRDKLRLERDKLILERSHLTLELDFLKMQISPHFLFNALNSIYSRVVDADELAASQVLRLAELMRYNLYEASAQRIALEHELNYINDYLQLEQSRHAQRISVTLEKDDKVINYQIAPLLLATFVENAFKHGVRAGQAAYIQVSAQMRADVLIFTVQNSLQKLVSSPGRKSGGMGLVNVHKRLNLLYSNRFNLVAGPVADQYVVVLQLHLEPLVKQFA